MTIVVSRQTMTLLHFSFPWGAHLENIFAVVVSPMLVFVHVVACQWSLWYVLFAPFYCLDMCIIDVSTSYWYYVVSNEGRNWHHLNILLYSFYKKRTIGLFKTYYSTLQLDSHTMICVGHNFVCFCPFLFDIFYTFLYFLFPTLLFFLFFHFTFFIWSHFIFLYCYVWHHSLFYTVTVAYVVFGCPFQNWSCRFFETMVQLFGMGHMGSCICLGSVSVVRN
jgi:hypothetical protein